MPTVKPSRTAVVQGIFLNQCRFLEQRYPTLLTFDLPSASAENAAELFDIYCWHVKRIDPAAMVLDQVTFYERKIPQTADPTLKAKLTRALFELQAARGMASKVLPLLSVDDYHRRKIDALAEEQAYHYGYDMRRIDPAKCSRDHALRFYFSRNPDFLKGKRVLHFAPELRIRSWMREAASEIGFSYASADGFIDGVDHHVDLCDMWLDDAQFDVVIIHRVLEHVIDDRKALSELRRILVPGGILNISVPEVFYLMETADWRVPDPKVHKHYRHYGRDFAAILEAAGFVPNLCDWLLKQPEASVIAEGAQPLRFFNAIKTHSAGSAPMFP